MPPIPSLIVLLAPEALEEGDLTALAEMLTRAKAFSELRALVLIERPTGLPLAATLAQCGVNAQWLLGPGAKETFAPEIEAHAPHGLSSRDVAEFAIAMSDVVVANSRRRDHPSLVRAAELGKPILEPGGALPLLPREAIGASGLEPYTGILRGPLHLLAGRTDGWLIEISAFAWRGWSMSGVRQSLRGLGKCFGPGWARDVEFPPDKWRDQAPDKAILAASGAVRMRYDSFERGALFGSRLHRDIIWLVHIAAAVAVLAAVAGVVAKADKWRWTEGATLGFVLFLIVWARFNRLQERWTACRLGAEQLRIACMCLPLLVAPPIVDDSVAQSDEQGKSPLDRRPVRWAKWRRVRQDLASNALTQARRAMREQGIPQTGAHFSPAQGVEWLDLFVSEQADYHRDNYHRLEFAERRLHGLTASIFGVTLIAVAAELYFGESGPRSLFVTAFGPALAAAIHGAATRLGMVHRAALSEDMAAQLGSVRSELVALGATCRAQKTPAHAAWLDVRRLALRAAYAMGEESNSWLALVRREPDDLP